MSGEAPKRQRVDAFAVHVLADRTGFALEVGDGKPKPLRLEFGPWAVHQLLRVLPHIDASLQQHRPQGATPLMAYPLAAWSVAGRAADDQVAVHLRDGRSVESAFVLDRATACALQRALAAALAPAGIPTGDDGPGGAPG